MRIKDDNEIKNILKIISPGTNLREGLENILRAKTGGLIVFGDSEEVMSIVDGGFTINAEYTPAYIYELAKMDGAIVLSEDSKRILLANTQLIPNYNIPTTETGTRHRTAERVARQTGAIVISISQSRNVITVYRGEQKYVVEEISEVFSKANQALQTLQKYKDVLDTCIYNLNSLEFSDLATIHDVIVVVQSMERVMRVAQIIEGYLVNLGEEGYLVRMQLEELLGGTEKNRLLLLKDYKKENIDFLKECDIVIEAFDDPKNKATLCNTVLRNFKDKYLKKMLGLRIFEDENGKTNLSLADVNGELLMVSQFTLYANCKKGNRPSFIEAGAPDQANELYEYMLKEAAKVVPVVQHGVFGADMKVSLENDGPFTIVIDSEQL